MKRALAGPMVALCGTVLLAGCGASDSNTFTLYRTSPVGSAMRIHVATFDAADSEQYNADNCDRARELFQAQPLLTVRYWCEKGRYRK